MDVLDPGDHEEIGGKLKELDFSHFVITQQELIEPSYSFQPLVEEGVGG